MSHSPQGIPSSPHERGNPAKGFGLPDKPASGEGCSQTTSVCAGQEILPEASHKMGGKLPGRKWELFCEGEKGNTKRVEEVS